MSVVKAAFQWIKANRVMLINSGSLIGTTLVTSALGFAYWWVAARQYSPEAVGLASAIVSTMILLGGIGMFGLGTLLITELPRQPGEEVSLISTGFIVAGGIGGAIGVLFAIFAPYISVQFAPLRASVLNTVVFAVGVGLMAATTVLDQALIGVLQGSLQFWRNAFFSLAKLVLLFAAGLYLSSKTGMTIYAVWVVAMALSVAGLVGYILVKKGWQGRAYLPQWQLLRRLGPAAMRHHLLNTVLQVPTQLLPVLVTILLSAKVNAWFYVSWMIASFVLIVPYSLTMVLHAMNSAEQYSLRKRARTTIGIAFATCLIMITILFLGTKLVLGLFGSAYAEQATWCLRILVLAAFPAIIKNHYISFCRIQDRLSKAMLVMLVGAILELGGAALGAYLGGLVGLCLGWLAATILEGLVMLPLVYRVVVPAKGALKAPLLEHNEYLAPIWLADTAILSAISPLHQTTAHMQVRMPTTPAPSQGGYIQNAKTITPIIKPALSALSRPTTTLAPNENEPYTPPAIMRPPKLPAIPDIALINTDKIRSISALRSFKRPDLMDILLLLLPLLALFLWSISLQTVSLKDINDLGLISVLSPGIIAAIGILVVSFALTLQRQELRVPLLVLHLACIILILYATPNLIEEMPHMSYMYRHAGYTEYIMRTGTVDPYLDTYFNWPGFFVLSAFFTKVFGYSTILSYAGWAPVFYNIIYFGPMYMIFKSITTNERLVWLSLLFFYLTNWVAQDYFSPQGLNFFLHLVIIAMLLKWFKIPRTKQVQLGKNASFWQKFQAWIKASDHQSPAIQSWQQRGLLCCMIFIYGLIVFSHPLTPFFTLLSVGLLVIFRRCYPFWLPILMAIMTVAWILIVAQPYLSQHLNVVIGTIGDLTGNVPKSITSGKSVGDPLYQIIAKIRLYMTVLLWLLAFLGAMKRLRQGHRDITYIILALAGFPLIAAQSYGGEMLLRIYLFTEPFMVFFAAALFCENPIFMARTRTQTVSPWRTIAIIAINLILLGAFFFTRYGDERVLYISYDEWNAVQYLYQIAPPKAFILEGWNDTPLVFENYEKYNTQSLTFSDQNIVIHTNIDELIHLFENEKNPNSYMIISQEQQIQATAWYGLPSNALQRLESVMLQSKEFKIIYSNSDTQILQFIG
jgi:O-antigen/teichoic acid export membrane protein